MNVPDFQAWQSRYRKQLLFTDAFVVAWATAGALVLRFGDPRQPAYLSLEGRQYASLAIGIIVLWWGMLGIWGSRDERIFGHGPDEYKRVISASFWLFGLIAIVSYALRFDTARGFVFLALPCGILGLVLSRWLLRKILYIQRRRGDSSARVMVVGNTRATNHLVKSLVKAPEAGYKPIAAYLVDQNIAFFQSDISVVASSSQPDVNAILDAINDLSVDAVAISAGSDLSPQDLRKLGWELTDREIRMIVAPALTDITGPRIHAQPVAGLSLIHVSTPKLTGIKWAVKRSFDVTVSLALLLILLPIFAATAVAIKVSSPGPIFYTQERIGLRGRNFRMYKFRSMQMNADSELRNLLANQGTAEQPLFKIQNDPRITPIGKIIRKYSIDELPQLMNVLEGSMSLVGPRPQRADEVALYSPSDHRRLYVSPGMSGLWQVSGRSNLTWDESIQLDLYYVENWSMTQDITILMKTFRAVFLSEGAV